MSSGVLAHLGHVHGGSSANPPRYYVYKHAEGGGGHVAQHIVLKDKEELASELDNMYTQNMHGCLHSHDVGVLSLRLVLHS